MLITHSPNYRYYSFLPSVFAYQAATSQKTGRLPRSEFFFFASDCIYVYACFLDSIKRSYEKSKVCPMEVP